MKRYWIPEEWIEDGLVRLEGETYHHIHRVCRNEAGSKFEVLPGGQRAYFVELVEAKKNTGLARILETREIPVLPKPHIHLALSIPRFSTIDWVIEKAVELGVYAVHPFVSDYSFVRKIDGSLSAKEKRWHKIVQGASQQSGRGDLMQVSSPRTLDQLLAEFSEQLNRQDQCLGLFPYEGETPHTIHDAMDGYRASEKWKDLGSFWIFVGSEGGFSSKEVEKFQGVGLEPVTLGEQILRVDTACLALVSIIKYELDLMRGGRK